LVYLIASEEYTASHEAESNACPLKFEAVCVFELKTGHTYTTGYKYPKDHHHF
jgi:hypothetical protein